MDVIKMARYLGEAIQQTEEYKSYMAAKIANDADDELQTLIGDFNLKRMDINSEAAKTEKDENKLSELDTKLKDIYSKIMKNQNMAAFNRAQAEMDSIIKDINSIIMMSANGQDPQTCELPPESGCGGGCGGCSGCGS